MSPFFFQGLFLLFNLNFVFHVMFTPALREDKYFFAGQTIAVSLAHGGPAPGFFSSTLYASLMIGRSAKPEMEDIADPELYAKVKKVNTL